MNARIAVVWGGRSFIRTADLGVTHRNRLRRVE